MATSVNVESTVVASADAISCDLKGEAIVLHISSGVYFGLEGVGANIWDLIRVPCTVSNLVDRLTAQFEIDKDTCRSRTLAFVEELAGHNLVIVNRPPGNA